MPTWNARTLGPLILALAAILTACIQPQRKAQQYQMGDRVQVASMIYTVIEASWKQEMGDGPDRLLPKHRFYVIRLSAMNGGTNEASVPSLKLVSPSGEMLDETPEVRDLPQWLGLIRTVKPAETLEGSVVFDVEPRVYDLRIADPYEDSEMALVKLPLRFDTQAPLSLPGSSDKGYELVIENERGKSPSQGK